MMRCAQLCQEFKLVTRSYAETDEVNRTLSTFLSIILTFILFGLVVISKNLSTNSGFFDLLFYYLSGVTGLASSAKAMSSN